MLLIHMETSAWYCSHGNMKKATPDSIPKIRFDNEINNLLEPKRFLIVSIQTRVGGGSTTHQQVLHPQVGKQLHGGNLHQGMSDTSRRTQGVSLGSNAARNVSVSRVNACQHLSHASHVHVAQVTTECSFHEHTSLHTQRSMAHNTLL